MPATNVLPKRFPNDPDRFRKPDVSFVSMGRMPTFPRGHCKIAPDLAVEVISPNETYISTDIKIDEYLKVGVKLVWVVVPDIRTIHIYRLDGSSQTLRKGDVLNGESILPGFHCPVMDVFPTVESRN